MPAPAGRAAIPVATAAATASATFDFLGADYATIRVLQSTGANASAVGPTISLLHADTSNGSFATVVADRSSEGSPGTATHCLTYHLDLKTKKRYGKLIVTAATATNDTVVVAADMTLSRLEQMPESTTTMLGSTNDAAVIVS